MFINLKFLKIIVLLKQRLRFFHSITILKIHKIKYYCCVIETTIIAKA